jgi:putative ABC transport system permease protein
MNFYHLRAGWRNLRRHPFYSFVNISCLAIGMAVSMTILLYVLHEHSYDRWQANSGRIFTTWGTFHFGNSEYHSGAVSYLTGPLLQKEDANVEAYLRTWHAYQPPVVQNLTKPGELISGNAPFLYADKGFFRFFSFRLLEGSPERVLQRPNTVVITARAAKKYFGHADPVGQMLLYDKDTRLEVTGVAADPPSNTEIDFDFVGSLQGAEQLPFLKGLLDPARVDGGNFFTYFRLKDASAATKVAGTMDRMSVQPDYSAQKNRFECVPLAAGHLYGREHGLGSYLDIFPFVAGVLLLLALINYMSLATARSAMRAREVGVRKVMGAGRGSIAAQFYTESALFALLSFGLGLGLFLLFRPLFLNLLQLKIDGGFLLTPVMITCFAGLLLVVIAVSGSYPSLVLSAFKPVAVLYGRFNRSRGAERVRKWFIVFQFTISMMLIVSSVIIEKELYLIRHTETGVDRENVVMVSFGTTLRHYEAFKRQVQAMPGVQEAATAHYPMYEGYELWSAQVEGSDKQRMLRVMDVDNDLTHLLRLKWKTEPSMPGELYDGKHVLLNEKAVSDLGLTGVILGRKLSLGPGKYTVGGVLKDFNYQSLQGEIRPLCLFVGRDTARKWGSTQSGCLFVRVNPRVNLPTLIGSLRAAYRQYDRDRAFEFSFMDDAFDKIYKAEDRLAGLLGLFTGITIGIACLGLFALATFAAEQRTREIGIRKVLGASVASLGRLLSVDFLRPVALATLIASPLAGWFMHRWLEKFAYRTAISWWIFPAAATGLLGIALATVLWRSLRAARENPVDNLRTS